MIDQVRTFGYDALPYDALPYDAFSAGSRHDFFWHLPTAVLTGRSVVRKDADNNQLSAAEEFLHAQVELDPAPIRSETTDF